MDINSLRERDNLTAFTVTELNQYVKNLIDGNRTLSAVTVKGEISNFTNHRSGHLYFSLKDAEGQIRCVMFRSSAARLKFMPESGMKVILHGQLTVYTRDGSYQLYASSMQPDGVGALYLAYEQLKARLSEEGIFDDRHKKPIPTFPRSIGVITSPTGAAIRDILNVSGRRYPLANVYIYPALVQGDGAERTLIDGIDYFDRSGLVDVVIIGRGGGSIEDLWAFNSEQLARRIYAAGVPVISAVGHETDFTICDFVSDLRAPTPSAAAELAVPDVGDLMQRIDALYDRCERALERQAERSRERFDRLSIDSLTRILVDSLAGRRDAVDLQYGAALEQINRIITDGRNCLILNTEKANAMNPLSVLTRGYSIAESKHGVITSTRDVAVGDGIRLRLSEGSVTATVTEIDSTAEA